MPARQKPSKQYWGYRSFELDFETMRKMYYHGFDTITFTVSHSTNSFGEPYMRYKPVWTSDKEYDFSSLDQNIQDILSAVPQAHLLCFIDLNPPAWWRKMGAREFRFDSFSELGRALANPDFLNDVSDFLQHLIRHCEMTRPGVISAFILGCGSTHEWCDTSFGAETPLLVGAFQEYRRSIGKTVIPIPDYKRRFSAVNDTELKGTVDGKLPLPENDPIARQRIEHLNDVILPTGLLRTEDTEEEALDFWKFHIKQEADAAIYFIRKAREVMNPETELGIIYGGAILDAGHQYSHWGHLGYERIYAEKGLNFAVAPFPYRWRHSGDAPISRVPVYSLSLHGKRMLNSSDTTTFTSRFPVVRGKRLEKIGSRTVEWKTPEEVCAGIKRETAYNLINGCSTWWFDQWGGWWDSDAAMKTLKKSKEIWDVETHYEPGLTAEVLCVVDPDNMYYINDLRPDGEKFVKGPRDALVHLGAPWAFASFNDLKLMDLAQFKLMVFCHPFSLSKQKFDFLQEKVLCGNRTVLWMYGPGIIDHGKWNPENVKKICGADFKSSGLQKINMKAWRSAYLSDPEELSAEQMFELASDAGVHFYSPGHPVNANTRLFSIHTGKAETFTVMLPQKYTVIRELYTEREFFDTAQIELTTRGADTFLFQTI
ncbi:MAG: hypothetical protein PHV59_01400 [Victivallales bacterium]|nr:hypothetical protein [Victivallales bacterium]